MPSSASPPTRASSRRRSRTGTPTTTRSRPATKVTPRASSSASLSATSRLPAIYSGPSGSEHEARDGYVSIEVEPTLAADTEATIAQATHFHEAIARPNLLVKIPATDAGVPAIEEMTARGYSINVTLIFSLSRHREIAEAYLRGLERLVAAGGDPSRVHSVASFFVSRVDTETDRRLAKSTATISKAASGSPTRSSPTSNTRSCSPASAGKHWPRPGRPRNDASGRRRRRRTRACETRSTSRN